MITSGTIRAEGQLDTREFSLKMLIIAFSFFAVLSGNIFLYQSGTSYEGVNTTMVKDSMSPAENTHGELIL